MELVDSLEVWAKSVGQVVAIENQKDTLRGSQGIAWLDLHNSSFSLDR